MPTQLVAPQEAGQGRAHGINEPQQRAAVFDFGRQFLQLLAVEPCRPKRAHIGAMLLPMMAEIGIFRAQVPG